MSPHSPVPPTQWSDPRHRLGLAGELAALDYLTGRGWRLEAHRFRVGRNDIDLIVRRGALVAFVEVKTRRTLSFGPGALAVGWKKRRALARAAEVWRLRHGRTGDTYRFDLCEVSPRPSGPSEVSHLMGAWSL
jgi:putative endonuclease